MDKEERVSSLRFDDSDASGKGNKDELVITLRGAIDENSNLAPVFNHSSKTIRINWRHVQRFNSFGVKKWIDMERAYGKGRALIFEECSVPVVKQMNKIPNLLDSAVVTSFFAPYVCPDCDEDHDVLIDCEAKAEDLKNMIAPEFNCPSCGEVMEFDDTESAYFDFINNIHERDKK